MRSLAPAAIHPPFAAYSHGVEARARRLVLTSGQLGIRPDGSIPEAAGAQAGLGREHILRLNAFVTDRAHMAGYMAARDIYLDGLAHKPASTLMIVSGFTRPEFLVEVEAMAAEEG